MAQPQPAIGQLLDDLRAGREIERCFRTLFEMYYPQVCRFFIRKGLSTEDARELAQDVFFSVYRGLGSIQDESHFTSWLFTIARNMFVNELERRHAKKRSGLRIVEKSESGEQDILDTLPSTAAVDTLRAMLEEEKVQKLTAALETLPPQMRRCIQLRVTEGCTYDQIAVFMGISVNTVKAHLHKARKQLYDKLSPYFRKDEILGDEER